MDYEQRASDGARSQNANFVAQAVPFAVLHLAEQVGRVADALDGSRQPGAACGRSAMSTVQLNLVMDEVQTLLSALGAGYVHPSLERFVKPLEVKLAQAERKLVSGEAR